MKAISLKPASHAGLVAENAAAGDLAAGIDGQHGDFFGVFGNQKVPEHFR